MTLDTSHAVLRDLALAGACCADELEFYRNGTRDLPDIDVLRCRRCGAFVLSSVDHVSLAYYGEKVHPELHILNDRRKVAHEHAEDTARRVDLIREHVTNKRWLDFGTGSGGILDALHEVAGGCSAIEPHAEFSADLRRRGYEVFEAADALTAGLDFDIITAFHVVEHLPDAVSTLGALRSHLAEGGMLVLEVPHARDALIELYGCVPFEGHTFWSEHLILHSRQTIEAFLDAAGYSRVVVEGVQRYPLANHLHWLSRGQPRGHRAWSFLRDPALDAAYESRLAALNLTDTLIAYAWA
jgi:2-polyprenyl-3-methyl-5-hydroxy-6-metoxy-1,4-benzoquinol methylase